MNAKETKKLLAENPHLFEAYRISLREDKKRMEFVSSLDEFKGTLEEGFNVVYPLGNYVFINVKGDQASGLTYNVIEPTLDEMEQKKYDLILTKMLMQAAQESPHKTDAEFRNKLKKLAKASTKIVRKRVPAEKIGEKALFYGKKVPVTKEEFRKILYALVRNVIESGILVPLLMDPYIEDIHCIGVSSLTLIHKKFKAVPTSVSFGSEDELDKYVLRMAERMGRPVSISKPIADGALPDGSRINIIYSDDVSVRGPSFTIRKFSAVPLSIIQLIRWGSFSSQMAAYIWLALENGLSMFVCGETASGKTTTLNASLPFILHSSKIYSTEDTLEVLPPHHTWQRLLTRESGPKDQHVDAFLLLKAALRSRPDYIIVGEIRGKEGAIAFQAMQTGHPVIATFHASSVKKMIQRFTGDPINVPMAFMDNLNICVIQLAVYVGGKFLRRMTAIEELLGYDSESEAVLTRKVFYWEPSNDTFVFAGLYNSYMLEMKIAAIKGYTDRTKIYDELNDRKRILERMIEKDIAGYHEVRDAIVAYQKEGVEGLPFAL